MNCGGDNEKDWLRPSSSSLSFPTPPLAGWFRVGNNQYISHCKEEMCPSHLSVIHRLISHNSLVVSEGKSNHDWQNGKELITKQQSPKLVSSKMFTIPGLNHGTRPWPPSCHHSSVCHTLASQEGPGCANVTVGCGLPSCSDQLVLS